jgi:hypothetical protein
MIVLEVVPEMTDFLAEMTDLEAVPEMTGFPAVAAMTDLEVVVVGATTAEDDRATLSIHGPQIIRERQTTKVATMEGIFLAETCPRI